MPLASMIRATQRASRERYGDSAAARHSAMARRVY